MGNPAKRLGLREIVVHFGTFDFELVCVVGPHRGVPSYVAWKYDSPTFDWDLKNARGHFFGKRGYAPIIWIPRRPRTAREHGTLAHEVLHAITHMLVDWIGMPLTDDTQEAFCHATGHAVTKILEGL